MTVPRYWPCWKGSKAASLSAISGIEEKNEPPSGPRKRVCWFSHGPMPRRKSPCWPRCDKASKPRFRSCGTGFSTACFRVPGMVCGIRSNSKFFTTTSAMPASSLNSELKTGVSLASVDPAIAANPSQMPAQVAAIVGPNYSSYNGLWNFTSSSNPGMWQTQKLNLQPRVGFAYRLTDTTAIRFGYAMYTVPTEFNFASTPPGVTGYEALNFLEPPYLGLTSLQNTAPLLNGVPQATLSNPYPSTNPLIAPLGKSVGTNLGRGGTDLIWYPQFFQKAYNHRLNLT